jgi:hypothetical protein
MALGLALGCAKGSSDDATDGGGVNPGADAGTSGGPDASVLPKPDAATSGTPDGAPVGGACNAVTQTGCSAGLKCAWIVSDVATQAGMVGCSPNGTIPVGGTCTQPAVVGEADGCIAGSHCVFSTCHTICSLMPSVPCSMGGCVGVEGLDFAICLPNCDPLLQDCPLGQGCYLTADGPVCATVVGAAGPGMACMYLNDCTAGSGCFDDGLGGGICYKYCNFASYPNLPDPTHCTTGQTCTGITGETLYGVCT